MNLFKHRSLQNRVCCAAEMRRPPYYRLARFVGWSVLTTLACSLNAQANFQYNYVEAAYIFGEFEFADAEVDVTGYQLTAQFDLSPNFVLGVRYSSLDGEDRITTVSGVSTLEYNGSGPNVYTLYHSPVGAQTDFLLGVGFDMSDFEATMQGDAPLAKQDEDTKLLFTGFRHRFSGLELHAQWSYNLDAEDDESEWSYTLGLLSGQPTGLQLGVQITPDDQGDLLGISIRQSY